MTTETLGLVATIGSAILHALKLAFGMTWQILWALILGFGLSAAVQSVVSKSEMRRLLPDDRPRTLTIACGLGAASSSCSYAAVALARSLYRKGANFTASMAFEIASTNLVIELGIIMALLIGWQFTLAEFVGGPIMVVFLALSFRAFLRPRLLELARRQAEKGVRGSMEGHAAMDMSVSGGSIWSRITSPRGFTAISHSFVMEWAAIIRDIVLGLLIAGALAAWVPNSFWQDFFLVQHPLLAKIWGPIVGPLVSMASFVCSIGNVPLAAVLWNGGILFLLATFYATMVAAGYVVEILFGLLHLIPTGPRHAKVVEASVQLNYTSVLNVAFLVLALVLVIRFLRTGGRDMLKMMNEPMEEGHGHAAHGA